MWDLVLLMLLFIIRKHLITMTLVFSVLHLAYRAIISSYYSMHFSDKCVKVLFSFGLQRG